MEIMIGLVALALPVLFFFALIFYLGWQDGNYLENERRDINRFNKVLNGRK